MEPDGPPAALIQFKGDAKRLMSADQRFVVVSERDLVRVFDILVRFVAFRPFFVSVPLFLNIF